MLRLSNIRIPVSQVPDKNKEMQALTEVILDRLKINRQNLKSVHIYRKSIDARKKELIFFVYTVDVQVDNEITFLKKKGLKNLIQTPFISYEYVEPGTEPLPSRPVIIGFGPAGLFAGLTLARKGYMPIILDRGEDVDSRTAKVERFWSDGTLDPESNVQFGEGGAGAFSDGKLTTLINDKRCRLILEEFIKAGAPEEILYTAKPHVGTDLLKGVVKNIRKEIISLGGEVCFKSKVTDFIIKNGSIQGVVINDSDKLDCSVVILAIGHSARDTFETLYNRAFL